MALSLVMALTMAAYPEGLECDPHALAPLALDLVMGVLHCLVAGKPSLWVLSLGHRVAALCLSVSRQSPMAWRMTHAAWLLMTRVALSWSPIMPQLHGGDLTVGGVSVPGEHSVPLLGSLSSIP